MSVYKPRGRSTYLYDFQWRGRRFLGNTRKTTRTEARTVEAKVRARVAEETGAEISLDVACGRYWLEIAETQPSAPTTEYLLQRLLDGLGKGTKLSNIDGGKLSDYISRRRGQESKRGGLVSPASVNRELELLRRVANRARDVWGVNVARIDWKRLKLREAAPRQRVLSDDEETRLLGAAARHLRPAIMFALATGLRLENIVALDWQQIDMAGGTMRFVVKGGKHHLLPMTPEILALLAGLEPKSKGPVFTYKGRAIRSWKTAWAGALRRAGVEDFRWHDLRHTVGSRLVARGASLSVVQDILGHADISTTRRYIHHDTSQKADALALLSRQDSRHRVKNIA